MSDAKDLNAEHAQTAAQIEPDVGVEHVADVYARALFSAAQRAGQTAAIDGEFDALFSRVLDPFPRFEAVLASAMVSHEETVGAMDRVLGGRFAPLLVNFLKVVSKHGRLDCLRAIHRRWKVLLEQLHQRVRVQLTTAEPLPADLAARIRLALRAAVGGEPILETAVDPRLIGGAVLRLGDTVYDGSIADQLKRLRHQIFEKSVHEIQSRRNRFRQAAGN
ncbi:MAG: ATP synthase F1 subunit delta [Pirellulales bacterium]|nr:ATP synthase F1 subunit delta [Pirellulales bacterium]